MIRRGNRTKEIRQGSRDEKGGLKGERTPCGKAGQDLARIEGAYTRARERGIARKRGQDGVFRSEIKIIL